MEFSWTTFLLEAINFLVLVWLLKRLFYAPVKRVIAARRAAVEQTLQSAQSARQEAEELKTRYEGRLREWEQEKQQQQRQFREELAEERARQLKQIEKSVAREREKAEAQAEKSSAERRAKEEKEAMQQALDFTSRLFGELACPELEGKMVDLVTKQIASASAEELPIAESQFPGSPVSVQVRSAYPLTEAQRTALGQVLRQRLGGEASIDFVEDPKLVAGLEIAAGAVVVRANLRDELAFFSSWRNHEQA